VPGHGSSRHQSPRARPCRGPRGRLASLGTGRSRVECLGEYLLHLIRARQADVVGLSLSAVVPDDHGGLVSALVRLGQRGAFDEQPLPLVALAAATEADHDRG
jgi:hypothetical protein